jgi:hypothetical protein
MIEGPRHQHLHQGRLEPLEEPGEARKTRGGSASSVLPSRLPKGLVRSAVRVERGARSSQRRG